MQNKITLICPHCKQKWGEMSFDWESEVKKENIKAFDKKHKFINKEGNLLCPFCSYNYTLRDIFLLILDQVI